MKRNLVKFVFPKNKNVKKVVNIISGIIIIYVLFVFISPNFLFNHIYQYKNFKVRSMLPMKTDSIHAILISTLDRLHSSEINDTTITHHIYLCSSFASFYFFCPFAQFQNTVGGNEPLTNSIFITKCDISKDSVYKKNGKYDTSLNEVLAHEITHTLIRKEIKIVKYFTMSKWKKEGYCEYISYNNANTLKDVEKVQTYLKKRKNKKGNTYRQYYYAIAYLVEFEKMSFDDITTTDLTLEQVLEKIEQLPE